MRREAELDHLAVLDQVRLSADASDCGGDARRFSLDLLQKEAVAATPGVDFGANGTARFVRFAYTRSMDDLEEAAARITRFVSSPSA